MLCSRSSNSTTTYGIVTLAVPVSQSTVEMKKNGMGWDGIIFLIATMMTSTWRRRRVMSYVSADAAGSDVSTLSTLESPSDSSNSRCAFLLLLLLFFIFLYSLPERGIMATEQRDD
jgi:hypothetical protein